MASWKIFYSKLRIFGFELCVFFSYEIREEVPRYELPNWRLEAVDVERVVVGSDDRFSRWISCRTEGKEGPIAVRARWRSFRQKLVRNGILSAADGRQTRRDE